MRATLDFLVHFITMSYLLFAALLIGGGYAVAHIHP